MPFKPGQKKIPGSGKKKGQPNRVTREAIDKAQELNIDPFEVLLHFAKGDWQALGYQYPTKTIKVAGGVEYEVDIITPEARLGAAKEAVQYLIPKRRSLEIDSNINLEMAKKAQEYSELTKNEQIKVMREELKILEGEN